MAHEITSRDNVVLFRKKAWHGLGVIVPDNMTPIEALGHIGAEYGIEQQPLARCIGHDAFGNPIWLPFDGHVANVRADLNRHEDGLMGVVTSSYHPVQNVDLARFCETLSDTGSVTVETAGTLQGGKKIWFLLQGKSITIGPRQMDEVRPYILCSNSHDGTQSYRITPTAVRVVCANTWQLVLGDFRSAENVSNSAFSIRHTTNVMERINEAKDALRRFENATEASRQFANHLATKAIKTVQLEQFFAECYQADFGPIPSNPQDKGEARQRDRAKDAFGLFSKRFDDELDVAGGSWWNAANAYTGLIQHDRKARGKDDLDRVEKRQFSNLFGLNSRRTTAAMKKALVMAG